MESDLTDFPAYITKYALTSGIKKVHARLCKGGKSMIKDVDGGVWACFYGEGKEWHRTAESAMKRAEEMRNAKITSLRKSIRKMEDLEFSCPL